MNLAEKVAQYPWHHSIDLGGGVVTPGGKSPALHTEEVRIIFGPLDLRGRSVLDIGAWNGYYSFEAKRRGARRVLATDHYCWQHPRFKGRETFDLARNALRLDIEALDIDIPDINVERLGEFDVVLFLGVFYHLIDPISALQGIAPLAKEVLVVETHIALQELNYPAMRFYPGAELNNDPSNWWGPNMACIRDLLRTIGFNRVQETFNGRGTFHAWR